MWVLAVELRLLQGLVGIAFDLFLTFKCVANFVFLSLKIFLGLTT